MPAPQFRPTVDNVANLEYKLPTKVENNKELDDYLNYLKSIGQSMGSITSHDLEIFYYLMKFPQKFNKENLNRLFTFLNQAARAEYFYDTKDAEDCIAMIETYRTEMDM